MALVKDEVIVLKSINYSDSDKILSLFGLNGGRFSIIAKGVRKLESKNRGNIQTGYLSKIAYFESNGLGILREAELISEPNNLSSDPGILSIFNSVLYLLYKVLPEGESDQQVFLLLQKLYKEGITLREVNRFRIHTLRVLGYLPDMKTCSICGEEKDLSFISLEHFQVCCQNCYSKIAKEQFSTWHQSKELRYESPEMTSAIDIYVRKVVENI